MSDDFERKLAVALKTAVQHEPAPSHSADPVALRIGPAVPERRPRPPRVLLVTAVLLALALVAGGAWWAVDARHVSTPAGDSDCTAADVTVSPLRQPDTGAESLTRLVIGVRAVHACSLLEPPTLTSDGVNIPWDATPQDTTDPNGWKPLVVQPGVTVAFAVVETAMAGGPLSCPGAVHDVELRFALANAGSTSLTFALSLGSCQTLGFISYEVPSLPCTASDLAVSRVAADEEPAGFLEAVRVQARSACTLTSPPTLVVASKAVAWQTPDGQGGWAPVTLAADDAVTFGVTLTALGKDVNCPAMYERPVEFRFGLEGDASLLTFVRTLIDECYSYGFTTVPG